MTDPGRQRRPFRFFHLADLHLGRALGGRSLIEDQQHVLAQITAAVERRRPDAVVIAGDLFDRAIASSEAIALCDSFLSTLSSLTALLIVPGNHDAAERLTMLRGLLAARGVHVAADFSGAVESVRFADDDGPIRFDLLPFLRPNPVQSVLSDVTVRTTDQAVRACLETIETKPDERSVLVCHQFAVSGDVRPRTSESEIIYVGATDQVDISAFAGYDYVALGHLHRPQLVGHGHIRYAGSPLAYSLSEIDHEKTFFEVTLHSGRPAEITAVPLIPLRRLVRLEGRFDDLIARGIERRNGGEEDLDYIHAVLTDESTVLDAMSRLRSVYPNMISLELAARPVRSLPARSAQAASDEDDETAFARFFELQTGRRLTDEQAQAVRQALEAARAPS